MLPPRALPHPAARPTMASAVADAGLQAVGPGTYAIEPRANAAFRVVNRLLASGISVARATGVLAGDAAGLAAGCYPAWRASRLSPAEALRSE